MVGLLACHSRDPCKNGSADRDGVRDAESGGPKEPCIRCGSDVPTGKALTFRRVSGAMQSIGFRGIE